MTTKSTTKARLVSFTKAQRTEHLTTGILMLDSKSTGPGYAGLDEAEVLTLLTMGDVLLARFPEADALIDTWMDDESPEGLAFIDKASWAELIVLAIDLTGNLS